MKSLSIRQNCTIILFMVSPIGCGVDPAAIVTASESDTAEEAVLGFEEESVEENDDEVLNEVPEEIETSIEEEDVEVEAVTVACPQSWQVYLTDRNECVDLCLETGGDRTSRATNYVCGWAVDEVSQGAGCTCGEGQTYQDDTGCVEDMACTNHPYDTLAFRGGDRLCTSAFCDDFLYPQLIDGRPQTLYYSLEYASAGDFHIHSIRGSYDDGARTLKTGDRVLVSFGSTSGVPFENGRRHVLTISGERLGEPVSLQVAVIIRTR